MAKLTIADLKKIKEQYHQGLREGGFRVKITVHMGTCGIAAGARAIMNAVMDALVPLRVAQLDMPATPFRVWQAIQDARRS